MSNRELASLAIKLLGVHCLTLVLGAVPILALWLSVEQDPPLLLGIGTLLVFAVLGVTMIWKSGWFARRMMSTTEEASFM